MALKFYELKFKKSPKSRKVITWHRYSHGPISARSKLVEICLRENGKRPVILSVESKSGL